MATRWGVCEETLTACNMDFFQMDTLDETTALTSEESLEALQNLDPSILSIFEDTPNTETKLLDDENEATLLTALTEILDNVDDENLSPFDTLPDSELLSGQKGRENSPLRRLLCLSRSPPEKDTPSIARPSYTGKNLPRKPADSHQRSDGEEEEDGSLTLSPVGYDSSPQNNMLDWEGLTLPLPITYEQEDENCVSVSLGDLVRHIHPYCMAICVENEEGEQILPEGGIVLEVVDQGENGEPILAIPDMALPASLPHTELKHQDDGDDLGSDSSEHIVVVDDDDDDEDVTFSAAHLKFSDPKYSAKNDEMIIQRQKDDVREKSPSRRRKKKKSNKLCPPQSGGRVLRSDTAKKALQELPTKTKRESLKEEKKRNIPAVPSVSAPSPCSSNNKADVGQNKTHAEIATTTQLPETTRSASSSLKEETPKAASNDSLHSCSPTVVSSQQPGESVKHPAPENVEESTATPSAVPPQVSSESAAAAANPTAPPVSQDLPPVASAVAEPKPKSLSLAEYRRLRQQKKPAPVENPDANNSSKWPSLPELPKELPPIPCLPDPSTKEPRRPVSQPSNKGVEEAKPAWQPRGRCAPPTPEALLVPPAYMVSSSSRVSTAATVKTPQQTCEPSTPSVQQTHQIPAPKSEKNLTAEHTCAAPNAPRGNDSAGHPETAILTSASGKCSPAVSDVNAGRSKSVVPPTTGSTPTTEATKPDGAAAMSASTVSQTNAVYTVMPQVKAPTLVDNPVSSKGKSPKDSDPGVVSVIHPLDTTHLKMEPNMTGTNGKPTTEVKLQSPKSSTQELIEAFTSEIGIEAADLTSLLEQFEETQAKEEKCVPEVSGRAAAVGNSSAGQAPEKSVVQRVRATDFTSTAALTPPATPPHQMWKPLAPVALLGKSKTAEASKTSSSKVIQIEAQPLPSCRHRSRPTAAAATVSPEVACMDHDYCLPSKGTEDIGKRWNVKQQSSITIKPMKPNTTTTTTTTQTRLTAPTTSARPTTVTTCTTKTQEVQLAKVLDHRTNGVQQSSVLETPDASPSHEETVQEQSPKPGPFGRSYRRRAASRSPSPRASPKEESRGRCRKRFHRSPSPMSSSSDSSSSGSRSRSPPKKRYQRSRSRSRSSSSSRSYRSYRSSSSVSCSPPRRRRYSYSSSRSGSWSRSRSRSLSPERCSQWNNSRRLQRPSCRPSYVHSPRINMEKKSKEKAIEERRVVYVGRIHGTMTQKELKERFSRFGEIEDCTLHFRDHGDHYGFVTFYDTKDAFTAIENGSKLRKPDELPFDLCFGGRRQFCQTSYADLDSNREYEPTPARSKLNALDFDTLLRQAQQQMKR